MYDKISEKLEELIIKALEKESLEEVAVLVDLRLAVARINSMEK